MALTGRKICEHEFRGGLPREGKAGKRKRRQLQIWPSSRTEEFQVRQMQKQRGPAAERTETNQKTENEN
jgi:hypothetical protein